ncbi:Dolichyl-phosphate-mannose-proteinmannosyltransferase [Tenacibaculum litopenaei]|uniref:ArnT family glycosyltransferase n=1 Tax=Tenacibaculum litopenaei TaxID=396016 RepID=UPI003892DED2
MQTKQLTAAVFSVLIVISLIGMILDVMAPDGALYASISKTMYLNNDFINLYSLGEDWLDKPHLPFWLTALSFKIFGVNSFAYKLPGVLVFATGVYYTYLFAKKYYSRQTGIYAAIILATALHSVLSNFDVRAEPFLTGFIIAAVYHFSFVVDRFDTKHLLIGSIFAACAMMTKGVFTLVPIVAALGGQLLLQKKWKSLFSFKWLLALVLIALFTLPEIYTLYQQFDLHPEKTVFGKQGVSGVRFFFWDSQFGRFFNTGPIVNHNGSVFFFLHTLLWAFLPWALLFYLASVLKIKAFFKNPGFNREYYSFFAAFTAILMFSLSKFQLAHYTNIIFPFMAIITADFIGKLQEKSIALTRTTTYILNGLSGLILVAIPLVYYLLAPEFNWIFVLGSILCIALVVLINKHFKQQTITKVFYRTTVVYLLVYLFMMTQFYPTLLAYQAGVKAAEWSNENLQRIHTVKEQHADFGFEFYLNTPHTRVPYSEVSRYSGQHFFVSQEQLSQLTSTALTYKILASFDHFRITKLNLKFANAKTRAQAVQKSYVIQLD